MHAAMDVGGKNAPPCVRFSQLHGNRWRSFDGTTYTCKGPSTVS